MNVALPALVVFVILLPGFVARARFQLVDRESVDYAPFGKAVTLSVIAAAFLHGIWLWLGHHFFHQTLNVSALVGLLSSAADLQKAGIAEVVTWRHWIAGYFGSLLIAVLVLPPLARSLVIACRLDVKDGWRKVLAPIFRFDNAAWYYALTAQVQVDERGKPDSVTVTAIVTIGDTPYVYAGLLHEFYTDNDGKLERLVLRAVSRCKFEDVDNPGSVSVAVECKDFILRYEDAVTITTDYLYYGKNQTPPAPAVDDPDLVQFASTLNDP